MRARTLRGMRMRGVMLLIGAVAASVMMPARSPADIASDHPAAILVFPKLIVDTSSGLDTMVRISNISQQALNVYCFYVNVTPECSLDLPGQTSCFPNKQTCFGEFNGTMHNGTCRPKWAETDFLIRLTREQPTGWLVSVGERAENCDRLDGFCSNDGTTPCDEDSPCPVPGSRCVRPACLPLDGSPNGRIGRDGQINSGAIPLSPEDPFIGELKCIAVDEGLKPVARNDLIGEVLIGHINAGPDEAIDVAGYNAIGIPALVNECGPEGVCTLSGTPCTSNLQCEPTNNRDNTLVLGGPAPQAEYDGCPNILILDHYFDGAVDPLVPNICQPDGTCSVSATPCTNDNECLDNICLPAGACSVTGGPCVSNTDCENVCGAGNTCTLSNERCLNDEDCTDPIFQTRVVTEVTLVPCTQDFENQQPELSTTIAQFLVFNEFEQRFSASITVECFREIRLSNIETTQNARSIFSAGVGGTLTGQTRIRGGDDDRTAVLPAGNALLGVSEEFRCAGAKFDFPLCNYVDAERLVSGTAKNLHIQGRRPQSDFIYLPEN
jgi:hypothetical protein